jgi:fructoselysine/glucoselysine PTS system EIIA component
LTGLCQTIVNMNRKFLIATHGAFAKGILSSLDIIAGSTTNVYTLQAYLGEDKSMERELDTIINGEGEHTEWVIFTDLLGGSITNQIVRKVSGAPIHIVAGVNLPLLLEVILADTDTPVAEVIENAVNKAREQMVYVNPLLTLKNNDR